MNDSPLFASEIWSMKDNDFLSMIHVDIVFLVFGVFWCLHLLVVNTVCSEQV